MNQQQTTNNRQLKNGFTLIEILVAVTVIGLLSTIGYTGFQAITRSGRDALRKSDLEQLRSALEIYKSEYQSYPTPDPDCVAPISSDYIKAYPTDPKPLLYQYCYRQTSDLSYEICAHLENSNEPVIECGGALKCGSDCNYQVTNP